PMGQHPQDLTHRACGPWHALPETSLVDRDACEEKPRLLQPREVRSDQGTPLLPLTALGSEVRRQGLDIGKDRPGIHSSALLSCHGPCIGVPEKTEAPRSFQPPLLQ